MNENTNRVGWRERGLALGALGCGLLVAVLLAVFVAGNLGLLVAALIGLALTVAGVWWAITERMPRRAVGIAGGVVGVIVISLGVIRTTPQADRPVLRLAILAVLLVGTVGCGRAALHAIFMNMTSVARCPSRVLSARC